MTIDWDNITEIDDKYLCPSCGRKYRSFSTIKRHKMVGCPDRLQKSSPTISEKPTFEVPDFDTILEEKEVGEPTEKNVKDFVKSLDFTEDEEGETRLDLSQILSDSAFLDAAFSKLDDVMYEKYYENTGEEIWSQSRRTAERDIFLFILKMNVRNTAISISPLVALITFSVYYYGIPTIKLIKTRGEKHGRREETPEENEV